jgi:hypothetical protein
VALRDESVAFGNTLTNLLLVQATSKLKHAVGTLRLLNGIISDFGGRSHREVTRRRRSGNCSSVVCSRGNSFGTSTKLFVFLCEATKFDNDLIEEVINLVLVVAFAELGRLETLIDNVFGRKRHAVSPHLKV